MINLTPSNIIEYVQDNTDIFGGETLAAEDISSFNPAEGQEGFVNYLFRVYNREQSVIVKQARPYLKVFGQDFPLDPLRNQIEYQTMKLRGAIIPEHTPVIYFMDAENHIFIMEDLSDLDVMRFQLNQTVYFPNFARQIAEFMARSHFYTSELFLEPETHHQLHAVFINPAMRSVMENAAFVPGGLIEQDENTPDQHLLRLARKVWSEDHTRRECYRLRDIFMKRGECLIHGDLHTSNILINKNRMKVFDMEYTFMGPYAFDMGYLIANFMSQFSAHTFKSILYNGGKEKYCLYLLDTIKDIYHWYMHYFNACWDQHAIETYRNLKGYRQSIFESFLPEMIGFAASANLARLLSLAGYPDYDCIENEQARRHAQGLSVAIDQYLLLNRKDIGSIDEFIAALLKVREHYLAVHF